MKERDCYSRDRVKEVRQEPYEQVLEKVVEMG
jgi:hypothetical protein